MVNCGVFGISSGENRNPFWDKSWSELGRLGNNRVVKTSYIWLFVVPFFAKLSESDFGNIQIEIPFTWQISYLAALFFTAGTIVFLVWCPKFLREYRDWKSFSECGGTSEQVGHILSSWFRNNGKVIDNCGSLETTEDCIIRLERKHCKKITENEEFENDYDRATALRPNEGNDVNFFWDVRGCMNGHAPTARIFVFFCFFFGLISLLAVIISNAMFVWHTL